LKEDAVARLSATLYLFTSAFSLLAIALSGSHSFAQDYSSRPITAIVPTAPGGGIDIVARIVADRMKTTLGQPVVIENIPAAAGTIGVGRLAQATPDGHTIGFGDQTTFIVSSLTNPVSYDVFKDFEPIALLSTSGAVLVGRNTLPPPDLKQLIAWLHANPGKATAGSFGQGSGPHILAVAFQNATATRFHIASYRGIAPALQDVIAGQLDLLFSEVAGMLPYLRSGSLKAYAVLARERSAAAPDVPTIDEAGGPPLHVTTWRGLWAPKGTPAPVIARLNAAVVEALSDAGVQKRIADIGQEIAPRAQQTPQGLAAHHRAEMDKWLPMVKAASAER
jgi:tripartite-type tricarboxylate transporter receptor subunit TctC